MPISAFIFPFQGLKLAEIDFRVGILGSAAKTISIMHVWREETFRNHTSLR